MVVQRRAAVGAALVLVLVGAACGGTSSAPVRHVSPTGSTSPRPAPTTTSAPTTTLPSAVPTTVATPVVPSPGWSRPLTALPPVGGFTSVSCISDVFCLSAGGGSNQADAADSTGPGVVDSWDGATWATPSTYFAGGAGAAPPPWMPSISCTDGPLCAVVDGSGHTSLGDGTTWSPPAALAPTAVAAADPSDPGPGHTGARSAAVACPTPQFCAYVDNTGHVATLHGTAWSAPQAFTTRVGGATVELFQLGRVGVSCATDTSCTAMVAGTVLDWDGTTWTASPAPWGPGDADGASAVSCPTPGTCVAVHGTSVSVRTPGSGWSAPRVVDAGGSLDSVSCPTTSTCVAADTAGDVVRLVTGTWSTPDKVVPTPVSYPGDGATVSCPTEQFCMVLTGDGDYATYVGTTTAP